jgi:5-methylcytosine-specific restriction endonuclease McrA
MSRSKIRIEKECLYCGKKFEIRPSDIKYKRGKFCSASCRTIFNNIHNNPMKNEEIKKKAIGNRRSFKGENNPFYNKKHSEETKKKISENHADVSGKNNPMYGRKGKAAPSYIDGRNSFVGEIYRKILLASGESLQCKLCGSTSSTIDVHHLDGNHKNNDLNNLIFLCRSCHMKKAHTYFKDDKGKFIGSKLEKLNL